TKSLEGQSFDRYVVETYVPLTDSGSFIGAFAIYSDVTASVEQMRHTILVTSSMPVLVMVAFVLVIGGLLQKVDRGIESVREAEGELIKYKESLEDQVEVRTAALREANEELESEMAERRHMDRALKESENFMDFIFESINDPFCIFDRDMNIVRANDGYAQLKGRTIKTLIGNQCFRILEGRDETCDKCVVSKTFDTRSPETKQKEVEMPGGDTAWVEIITYPIFDPNENVEYVVEYTHNITHRIMADEEKKRLIRELETLSRTDPLTGMLNRRAVNEELEREFWRAKRYGHPISVIVCDVDFFKNVNDNFGHAAGDTALIRVAGAICSVLRQSDVAGRYGGDEFLILLPETASSGAMDTSERLRIETSSVERAPGKQIITMSLGVATIKSSDESQSDLLKRADSALYASKNGGRNRSTLSEEDGSAHRNAKA
ncbi:MAG: diguanylate cyclase, partial [Thermodesulfovibrionales bacterium]|nr:diguanylate cyclase [Thermodesulfovibrionales bacterium]